MNQDAVESVFDKRKFNGGDLCDSRHKLDGDTVMHTWQAND